MKRTHAFNIADHEQRIIWPSISRQSQKTAVILMDIGGNEVMSFLMQCSQDLKPRPKMWTQTYESPRMLNIADSDSFVHQPSSLGGSR